MAVGQRYILMDPGNTAGRRGRRAMAGGTDFEMEQRILGRDGNYLAASFCRGIAVKNEQGPSRRMVLARIREVEDRRRGRRKP